MPKLPTLKLTKGNVYELTLKYDEPKTGETKGREWFLYTVNYDGQDCVLFMPSEKEHKAIQQTRKGQGDTITIGVDNQGHWHVGDNALSEIDDPFTTNAAPPPKPPMTSASHKPKKSFEGMVDDYRACLAIATEVCTTEFETYTNEDIRAIATTLYIQGTREGVNFPKE